MEKPCQKIGAFDWGPTTDHGCGDAFVSEAKDYGTQVAVELALESARKLAEFPSASQVLYLCTRRRASRARLHEVARTAAVEVAAQLPEPSHDPWRPPSDSPATLSELGPAPPRKSRADQVSPPWLRCRQSSQNHLRRCTIMVRGCTNASASRQPGHSRDRQV